jgi:hypothetical protein
MKTILRSGSQIYPNSRISKACEISFEKFEARIKRRRN